ncbi:MAG: Spy0128 family protein [Marvinbryantia sp.]
MKKRRRTLFSILFIVFLLCTSTMQIFAMETSFQLPVEIVLEGDRPVELETFVIRMKAMTADAPMPEQTKDQEVVIEIQGAGKAEFPSIKFSQPGVYQYEITQQEGNAKYYTYDSCVYHVTVYCTAGSAKKLETTVVALKQGEEGAKKEAVCFTNRYKLPKNPVEQTKPSGGQTKPVKTGDDTPTAILLCTMLMSGFLILLFVVKRHRNKKEIRE